MKPEVLAWALLFVIATGIVYRFFAWLGRRFAKQARKSRPQAERRPRSSRTTAPADHLGTEASRSTTGRAQPAAAGCCRRNPAAPSIVTASPPMPAPPSRGATNAFDASAATVRAAPPPATPSAAPPRITPPSVSATLAPPEPRPAAPSHSPSPQATPQPPRPAVPSRPAAMSPIEAAAAAAAIAMRASPSRMLAPNVAATVAPTAAKPIETAAVAQPKAAAPAAPQFAGASTRRARNASARSFERHAQREPAECWISARRNQEAQHKSPDQAARPQSRRRHAEAQRPHQGRARPKAATVREGDAQISRGKHQPKAAEGSNRQQGAGKATGPPHRPQNRGP